MSKKGWVDTPARRSIMFGGSGENFENLDTLQCDVLDFERHGTDFEPYSVWEKREWRTKYTTFSP